MSVILSGPRRVYVVLLFWQKLADPCTACARVLSGVERALGAEPSTTGIPRCQSFCLRLHRVLWRHLVGLSLLVLDPQSEKDN